VVLETHGSNCLTQSISLNRGASNKTQELLRTQVITDHYDSEYNVHYAHLKQLTSRATSLGASSPAPGVVRTALDRAGGVKCVNISDELSMMAALRFAGSSFLGLTASLD
jgi:L-serine/L-threonine ammonia-lyase